MNERLQNKDLDPLDNDFGLVYGLACRYWLLPTRSEAAQAFASCLHSMQSGRELLDPSTGRPKVGDSAWGLYPMNTVFILDRAVAGFWISPQPAEGSRQAILEHLVSREAAKLTAMGMKSAPPLDLRVALLSKHVNRKKGEMVRVQAVSSSPDCFPIRYFVSVRRGSPSSVGDGVWDTVIKSQDGTLDAIWDGRYDYATDGEFKWVPNGEYTLTVKGEDLIRRSRKAVFGVEVNNQ